MGTRILAALALAAPLILLAAVPARAAADGVAAPPSLVILRHDPQPSSFRVPPPRQYLNFEKGLAAAKASRTINFLPAGSVQHGATCTTWPEAAMGAFTYAANVWASLLQSAVPIAIEACWANNLGADVLGQAGPATFYRDFPGAPAAGTWYPVALVNALRGSDIDATLPDVQAAFSSTFDWHFGTDGNPGSKVDFASVVLHEIGHGLGFLGFMDVAGGVGSWGDEFPPGTGLKPSTWDRFTENGAGQSLVNTSIFPNPSAALATQLQGGSVFFDGPGANAANGGSRVPLYAPNPWQEGSSYSHLAETFNNTANALMTFSLPSGEAIHDPGPVALGMLKDMGWSLLASTATLTVAVSGNGVVNSSPAGIGCPSGCSASFPLNTVVTLTATPNTGFVLSGWSGACTGTGACVVTLSAARSVTATFAPAPPATFTLGVAKFGTGSGTVTSAPGGIACGAACAFDFANGQSVTLAATAAAGSVFTGWSGGGCSGIGACTVTMKAATTVNATFVTQAGTLALAVIPATLDFGAQSMGTTSPAQAVTVVNVGNGPVTVGGVSTTDPQFAQANDCATLAVGAGCTVTVSYSPAISAGALLATAPAAGSAIIASDAASSPHAVVLAGAGEKSLVTHYYRSILRRAPDAGGKAFWEVDALRVSALGADVNETWYSMAGAFYTSAEYLAFGRDDAGFVTDLYNTFFNRPPDGAGLAFWTGELAGGLPREVALVSFMFSPEFVNFTQALFGSTTVRREIDTVVDFYRGLLGRLPDDGGFAFWVQQFRAAQCQGAAAVTAQAGSISSQFALSAEYDARSRANAQYVGDLYNAFLRRGGDRAGVLFWINEIASGARTRENVRRAFVASPEFQARVAAIIAAGCVQ